MKPSFIISSCDPAKLLEFVEHALNTISVLVGFEIAGGRFLPIGLWRNDGADALDEQFLAHRICITAYEAKR